MNTRTKLAALIILVSFLPVGAQQILDRIIAIVNDDVILESEVVQGAYLAAMQMQIDPTKSPAEFERLKKETLNNLVNQKILLVQADKDTIKAEDSQVEKYLQQQMQNLVQQLGGQEKVEEYFGTTMSKIRRNYRDEIERNLRIRQVQQKKFENIKISRREVEQFYRAMKDSIGPIKETVDISHILITVKPGEAAQRTAYEKAAALRERLLKGEDFAALAEANSEDPGSASRGGDLGLMSRGEFVREFEEAAFKLEPNQISEVVRTQFGYHILQLVERRGEKIRVRHILITIKPTREDEVAAADSIKKVYKLLKGGADFVEMVNRYSNDESSKADKGFLGHFEIDQLRDRAKEFVFAVKDVAPGQISEPVKTQYGFHILRVEAREKARDWDLNKDYDRLSRMALEAKTQKEFERWIEELKKDIYVEIKPIANE